MLIILQCFKDFYLRARQGTELRAHREHPSALAKVFLEKYRSARPRQKKTILHLCCSKRVKAPPGGPRRAHPRTHRAPSSAGALQPRQAGGAGPGLGASRAGRGKATKSAFPVDFNKIEKVLRFFSFNKRCWNSIQAGINLSGRKGRTLRNSKLSSRQGWPDGDYLGAAPERDSQAKLLPQKSRRRPSPELPPPGDRPGGTFCYPDSFLSKSCRKPTIFPRLSLSARSNLISLCIVSVPGAEERPRPGRAPAPEPRTPLGLTWWPRGRVPPRSGSSPGTGKVSG